MRLWSIEGNRQQLDGGAMFGNAPRALWQRWCPPDADGRIPLACRALLVEDASVDGQRRRILCEAGVGAFFAPALAARYGVDDPRHVLLDSLAAAGVRHEDIDVVVLSHLHFDHAGGLLAAFRDGAPPALLFPRARFVVGARAFQRALAPHPRDRASFIPELPALLERSGRLELIDPGTPTSNTLGASYRFHFSDGHTPGLMLLEIPASDGPIVYASDLIPGRPWVHLPITMGYDRFPEQLIDEKAGLLADLLARGGSLFFTHDPAIASGRITRDDHGRYSVTDTRAALVEAS